MMTPQELADFAESIQQRITGLDRVLADLEKQRRYTYDRRALAVAALYDNIVAQRAAVGVSDRGAKVALADQLGVTYPLAVKALRHGQHLIATRQQPEGEPV